MLRTKPKTSNKLLRIPYILNSFGIADKNYQWYLLISGENTHGLIDTTDNFSLLRNIRLFLQEKTSTDNKCFLSQSIFVMLVEVSPINR